MQKRKLCRTYGYSENVRAIKDGKKFYYRMYIEPDYNSSIITYCKNDVEYMQGNNWF